MDMGRRIFALVRTAFFATLFLLLWLRWIPFWIVGRDAYADPRPAGFPLLAIGIALGLWCAFEFAWRGLGTPAPFDPPRRLVVTGLYRFVRNPMYVGLGIALIGEAIVFPHLTISLLVMLGVLWIATNTFIVAYEEPTLRRLFGEEYALYCSAVRRWIPRLTPFDMPKGAAVQ